ncbi:hypothetical protein [Priestia sp. YIM B13489]|uniref:hypothetical protein n=1 Tax=Priestia sp. YIM B13489 TaxID=3366313 RepID=UPI00366C5568
MLRDPIDRIISFYYYWLNCGLTSKSLEEFVNSNEPQLFNLQTTFISGKPLGIEPDLEVAKKNLTEKISTFGIMENFNESLFLLKKDFGWSNLNYEIANVTPNRPNKKQLPSKIIDAIKEKNELDIKLYTYAKKTFKDRLNLLDSHTQQELGDFIKK